MKLLFKDGKNKSVTNLFGDIYVRSCDYDEYNNGDTIVNYIDVKGCAVMLGYLRKDFNYPDLLEINERVEIYIDNMRKAIFKESLNSAHFVFASKSNYLIKLLDITENDFNNFVEYYTDVLNKQKEERQQKYESEQEAERLAEQERVNKIKENIVNNIAISGRDLLDVINDLQLDCPLRTKGFINKCNNINSTDAICPKQKSKISQTAVNNLFKWHKIVSETIKENIEWENTSQEDKDEIERLFNGK